MHRSSDGHQTLRLITTRSETQDDEAKARMRWRAIAEERMQEMADFFTFHQIDARGGGEVGGGL